MKTILNSQKYNGKRKVGMGKTPLGTASSGGDFRGGLAGKRNLPAAAVGVAPVEWLYMQGCCVVFHVSIDSNGTE